LGELLRSCDIALVPSIEGKDGWYESFCMSALEKMACGLPVIASDSGALGETVGDGGYLVPPNDADAIASRILELVRSHEPGDMYDRALRRASEFSHAAMVAAYDEFASAAAGLAEMQA